MSEYLLSFKPATVGFGGHDPSAAIFRDGTLVYAAEEERFSRNKHAVGEFPENAIKACLDHCEISLPDVDTIILPYKPKMHNKLIKKQAREIALGDADILSRIKATRKLANLHVGSRFFAEDIVKNRLKQIGAPVPPIKTQEHHACHAASAFHPSGFSDSLVLTLDGKGEYDSTVVWRGSGTGLERLKTYQSPNSLGNLYGVVTEYLGYYAFNGEGKIMGLAPYGSENKEIETKLRSIIDTPAEYDVTELTSCNVAYTMDCSVSTLEELFDRPPRDPDEPFEQWHKDLAYTLQMLLEEIVLNIVRKYLDRVDTNNVALAGGVALNCKLNKEVMQLDEVEEVFIQPAAHDGGLALGGGMIDQRPSAVDKMENVYWGDSFDASEIEEMLEKNKIAYEKPENLTQYVAEEIADGALVGWFQGRMEVGPRALGNRSILADPRTKESLDNVNKYVKHREEWRPFAPSMLEEAIETYLVDGEPAPFMIKTFETDAETGSEMEATIHQADSTTRPQTVRRDQNPRYYDLISEFENITGVPVLLNTSFNDHGEPIVRTPREALKDFYSMGLDILVLEDYVLTK